MQPRLTWGYATTADEFALCPPIVNIFTFRVKACHLFILFKVLVLVIKYLYDKRVRNGCVQSRVS